MYLDFVGSRVFIYFQELVVIWCSSIWRLRIVCISSCRFSSPHVEPGCGNLFPIRKEMIVESLLNSRVTLIADLACLTIPLPFGCGWEVHTGLKIVEPRCRSTCLAFWDLHLLHHRPAVC